jgi:hypothetical protein
LLHKYSQQELVTETTGDPGTAPTCGYDGYSKKQKLLCRDIADKTRIHSYWIGYRIIVVLVATVVKKGDTAYCYTSTMVTVVSGKSGYICDVSIID